MRDLSNSTIRIHPFAGAETIDSRSGDPYQPFAPAQFITSVYDNWTMYPGKFTTAPGPTEILCVDRRKGEAQILAWSGGTLKTIVRASGWRPTAQVTIAPIGRLGFARILLSDSRYPDLEDVRWDGRSGLSRYDYWPKGRGYVDLKGAQQATSFTRVFAGNFINSGQIEFLVLDALWLRLMTLERERGLRQIGPDMTGMQFRGDIIAGHFTNTTTKQILYLDSATRGLSFFAIDPQKGLVQIGKTVTCNVVKKGPYKIFPTDPPAGQPTLLICKGQGITCLRYDAKTTIAEVSPRVADGPTLWPYNEYTDICCGNFTGSGNAFLYYEPATFNPTRNTLADFDICLARSAPAINSQIVRNWRHWMKEKRRIFYGYDKDGTVKETRSGMVAWVAPIKLELAEPNAKLDQVRVRVDMIEGVVTYHDDEEDEWKDYPFVTWEFSFLMNLDVIPVDLGFLSVMDPGAHQTARDVIQKSGLPESAFGIDCLILKSTDTKGRGEENVTMTPPSGAPEAAQAVMKRCVNLWRQGEIGRFLLGSVTRRAVAQGPPPTFAVTSLAFSVHPDFEKADGSTLAWLGMMEGRPMPNLNQARAKLTDAWMRPPDDKPSILPGAVMAISRTMFMDRYLIARFAAAFGTQPQFALTPAPQWTFTKTLSNRRTSDDIIHRVFEDQTTWTMRLTIAPQRDSKSITVEGCKVDMTVDVVSQVNMDGYTHGAEWHSEWIHTRGRLQMKGAIRLAADYSKGYFAVKPTLSYGFDVYPVVATVEQNDVVGGAKVLNALESVFKDLGFQGSTTAERLGNRQQTLITQVMQWAQDSLKTLNTEFAQHAFIPNGGGILRFANPQFTDSGDLLFDVTDKEPQA